MYSHMRLCMPVCMYVCVYIYTEREREGERERENKFNYTAVKPAVSTQKPALVWLLGLQSLKWKFPKIRGTLFRGPYNKDPTI